MSDPFRQGQFLDVADRDEAEARFRSALVLSPLEPESVPLAELLGRVLADDIYSPIDVPGFDRSNVDGFAVRSGETFGATEDRPAWLDLWPEPLVPGMAPADALRPGLAMGLATGSVLPRGADAVVMVEDTEVHAGRLRLSRPAAPGSNVTFAGTDIGRGELVLTAGTELTCRETGVIAALGLASLPAVRRPRVAILSTGGEVVEPGRPLPVGCVYDSNATVIADACREIGCVPVPLGIVPDNADRLAERLDAGTDCDALILSGGTSKSAGDLSHRAVAALGRPGILVHGVALKPGKPLCLGAIDRPGRRPLPVAVLPGFPTSAVFTFHEFLAPVLRAMAGRREPAGERVRARLPFRVNSDRGRTEYLLVGLTHGDEGPVAYPMGKGSGSVTAFARSDGFVTIDRHREYIDEEEIVEVRMLGAGLRPADLVVIGSQCLGLDLILGELSRAGLAVKFLAVGSTAGLAAARRGECDVAGMHLLDPATDTYNRPFLSPGLTLLEGYGRRQGFVFRADDPRFAGATSAREATALAMADPECLMINRNRGSGTRLLIDQLLDGHKPSGYSSEARSHQAVTAAVAQGRADWGLAIEPSVRGLSLGFLPVRDEQYDFVIPESRTGRGPVIRFREVLASAGVRQRLLELGLRLSAMTPLPDDPPVVG